MQCHAEPKAKHSRLVIGTPVEVDGVPVPNPEGSPFDCRSHVIWDIASIGRFPASPATASNSRLLERGFSPVGRYRIGTVCGGNGFGQKPGPVGTAALDVLLA
jgi:hypothetical protein